MTRTLEGRGTRGGARSRTAPILQLHPGPTLDYPLIAILATLLAVGLVMVYSASFVQAAAAFFVRQIAWVAVGIIALVVMSRIPYQVWQRMAIPIMAATVAMLVAVLIFGDEVHGARRTFFGGSIQPSEPAKLALVIYVAAWVTSRKQQLSELKGGLIPFAVLMGIVAGLIVLERSFSVTIIMLVIGGTIFFVGGGDVKQIALIALIGGLVLALLLWQTDYTFTRFQNWRETLSDPSRAPYDVAQAMAIIRRGVGIGTNPSNLLQKGNVPLLWSDYMFANVAADLRFVGAVLVVILFAALGYRGLGIALNAPDRFAGLTAVGITAWILVQTAIHMGASLALIPTTGVPLPFMSYGGSSMLACMAAMGLLLSIARASPEKKAPYATFAFGWRNRWARLSDSGRGKRVAGKRRTRRQANR
jgi:cell division protein FtsW